MKARHLTLTSLTCRRLRPSVRQFSTADSEQFGYRKVAPGEKQGLVGGVFSSVADSYDVMNDLMSAGMHRLWKDEFVKMIGVPAMVKAQHPDSPLRFLDVAGGTGDISFRIIKALERAGEFVATEPTPPPSSPLEAAAAAAGAEEAKGSSEGVAGDVKIVPNALVTVSDINVDMLGVGKQRALKRFTTPTLRQVAFQEANAQELPFADNSFDVYTIAFGLRNVTDLDLALREARRVLKPGGRFLCLEFSHIPPSYGPLGKLYDAYSFAAIPALGQVVAGDRPSYQYLVESIRLFPKQEELVARMEKCGFAYCAHTNFTAGVVAVHSGFKL
mmetsp:Transcript_50915/g.94659  ORF Transcript_50915/g.94659 Transcript_50915/m.94659 type:complete len:330 (+) Transcript_50915:25-1014(+)|eukprot:CAMPEP_0171865170 /NCGR_PEP_ID=MMETSP0992-20121227/29357_1 /TAXON_ID=483369 /ORGANISM="non described non described, Strain CCMP2098" /LENGTH=329 /DNA_ID=CAMNT_0012488009 /DNA_START=20 /DNA_END=1009 /DNA_ORIENTATION=-